jgi:hypothetical protein
MNDEQALRDHLAKLLDSDNAHIPFDGAVKDFPPALRGARPDGVPHSAWQLLEHLRIAQWDILAFTCDPKHRSPKFPDGYWPPDVAPPTATAWDESVASFRADLRAFRELVANPATDLFTPLGHGDGQTPLREVFLVADHNAYHLGQLMTVRKMLGA